MKQVASDKNCHRDTEIQRRITYFSVPLCLCGYFPGHGTTRHSPRAARHCPACSRIVLLALLSALLAIAPRHALAAARPAYGGTLRISFSQPAVSLDPALAATLPERTLSAAVYETLTELGENGLTAPALAVNWESELGGKRWVFTLRSDARFHNGDPFTAQAACASLLRAVAQSQSAVATQLRGLSFTCTGPAAAQLICETSQAVPVLPAMLGNRALAVADADGSGTGPFRLARFESGVRARLEAFENYPQGRPFLDAVEADFAVDTRRQRVEFEVKRADVIAAPATEARLPGPAQTSLPVNVLVLAMPAGTGHPLSAEARRAIAAALNRESLVRLLPPGRAETAEGFLPGWLSGYEPVFAAEAATPRLAAASPAFEAREYRLAYDASDPVARLIASRLALDLRPLGVSLRLDGVTHSAFAQSRASSDFYLETAPLGPPAGPALAAVTRRYDLAPFAFDLYRVPGESEALIAYQYQQEKATLEARGAIPLLHSGEVYSFQPWVEQANIMKHDGRLDLANIWKSRQAEVSSRQ